MKSMLMIGLLVGLAACGGDATEEQGMGTEIQADTQEKLTQEEAYQMELEAIDRELDSLMNAE